MAIRPLTDLFQALTSKAPSQENTAAHNAVKSEASTAPNPEAVKVARDFGQNTSEAEVAARRKKVEELGAQVRSKTYDPDRLEVAKAVARELLF